MIRRLGRFGLAAYPPVIYLPFTALWALGLTGLIAAAGTRAHSWSPSAGMIITTLTLFGDVFLLRALDDMRDFSYDRAHSPSRPLPSGMVKVPDLVIAVVVGCVALLLLNGGQGVALMVLAVQLSYAIGLVAANSLGWPATEKMVPQLLLNLPIQALLCLYVYAAFLRGAHQAVSLGGLLAMAAVLLANIHLEFARKLTRSPLPGERTYVRDLGFAGAAAVAIAVAVATAGLAVAITRPWAADSPAHGSGWLAVTSLVAPAAAGWRFWRRGLTRWPPAGAIAFPLSAGVAFFLIGLLASGHHA